MKEFNVFLKKELLENTRTVRLPILIILFVFFGITGPFTAKLTPFLLETLSNGNFTIEIPAPTIMDSYAQFFKNFGQLGIFLFVLLTATTLTKEYSKGSLINILTKGVSRTSIIMAKFINMVLLWTLSYITGIIISYIFTCILFPNEKTYNVIIALLTLYIFGIVLISFIMLFSSFSRNTTTLYLYLFATVCFLFLLNIVPFIGKYNITVFITENLNIMDKSFDLTNLIPPFIVSFILVPICLFISIIIFKKKKF